MNILEEGVAIATVKIIAHFFLLEWLSKTLDSSWHLRRAQGQPKGIIYQSTTTRVTHNKAHNNTHTPRTKRPWNVAQRSADANVLFHTAFATTSRTVLGNCSPLLLLLRQNEAIRTEWRTRDTKRACWAAAYRQGHPHTHTSTGFSLAALHSPSCCLSRNSEGKQVQVTMRKWSYMAHVVKGKDPDLPHKFSLWSCAVLLGVWVEVPRDLCDYVLEWCLLLGPHNKDDRKQQTNKTHTNFLQVQLSYAQTIQSTISSTIFSGPVIPHPWLLRDYISSEFSIGLQYRNDRISLCPSMYLV